MIKYRTAQQCGKADYGWLQARTFSFGHYFDPHFFRLWHAKVLNQKCLPQILNLKQRPILMWMWLTLFFKGSNIP